MGFLLRWIFAFTLVAATFNPTRWNFLTWAQDNYASQLPFTVLLGLLLFVGYVIYIRATLRSIGAFGMMLVIAVFGALIWVLYDIGVLSFANTNLNMWIAILALSLILGIGLSWSIVRRSITGQLDVDDTDE